MQDKKYLNQDECLGPDDALVSPNGIYYAILHSNGSVCIYAGGRGVNHYYTLTPPSDKANGPHLCLHKDGDICLYPRKPEGGTQIWASKTYGPWGKYQLWLEDDGTLVVYRGFRNGPVMWKSNSENKIKEMLNLKNIKYDLDNVIQDKPEVLSLSQLDYINNSDIDQQVDLKYEKIISVSMMHSFTSTNSFSTSFKVGYVPGVTGGANFEIELKYVGTWTTQDEKKEIETVTYSDVPKITVEPHTEVKASVLLNKVNFHVPFTSQCDIVFENGDVIPDYVLTGTYTSNGAYDLRILVNKLSLLEVDKKTKLISSNCEDIIIL